LSWHAILGVFSITSVSLQYFCILGSNEVIAFLTPHWLAQPLLCRFANSLADQLSARGLFTVVGDGYQEKATQGPGDFKTLGHPDG
jgi:hypothetical protein